MSKRTHKRRALGDVATVIAASTSVAAAAKALGVSRQCIYEWIKAGKAPRPSGGPATTPPPAEPDSALPDSADGWAASVRRDYTLSATENVLVSVGHGLLTIALNDREKPADRSTASGRWLAVLRTLNLEKPDHGEAQTPADVRAFPRRVG